MSNTLFTLHLSTSKPGMVKGPVNSFTDGMPLRNSVRMCLPGFYRKAFDRSGQWCIGTSGGKRCLYYTLTGVRGHYLNTIYAIPNG